jgi:hypothetical protein
MHYQFSPHLYLEFFEADAVLLIADRDVMVTLNHAAARLFEEALELFQDRTFSRSDCVDFLLHNYDMTASEAEREVRSLLGFGLIMALVVKKKAVSLAHEIYGAAVE